MRNYLLRRIIPAEYIFRNGFRMVDTAGTLAGTIAVVFIRREYGLVENCDVIVDIGANMGCFAVFVAAHSPNARVYCYEPEPRNFAALNHNITLNSLTSRIVSFQAAVAANVADREMVFGESPLNSLIPGFVDGVREMVKCTTLHDILETNDLDNVDLLKMNCEGAEYETFANCDPHDLERISRIRVEYHNLNSPKQNGEWLRHFFEEHGYSIERFTRYRGISGFIWAAR